MKKAFHTLITLFALLTALSATAYDRLELFPRTFPTLDLYHYVPVDTIAADSVGPDGEPLEIEFDEWGFPVVAADTIAFELEPFDPGEPISRWEFSPIVYDSYIYDDRLIEQPERPGPLDNAAIYGWLDDFDYNHRIMQQMRRDFILNHSPWVRYNVATLPEPPKHYHAFVDPVTTQIVVSEELPKATAANAADMVLDVKRRNWLQVFNASLQFSQAYVSPNWYQGGNNNLNMLANIYYNIKLNEAFHKNVMFDTTIQYKLGLNSAPDDSLRSYSISEDLLQITSKFGYRAAKRWFYSLTMSFKTQVLNSYISNTNNLKSAFLSPGELNVGVGMTYNYANPKKTFTFNASISPISWNMKTCINSHLDETAFGIRQGRSTVSDYGSSTECTLSWKIAYNITYSSRLFAFTDYDYFQGDWEHTLSFDINRFLTTQIYAHMRYDTTTPRINDTNKWHKFQFKEILSFGVAYKFSTK